MNKNKQVLTFLMALMMIVSLAACSNGSDGQDLAGTYNLSKMSSDGEEITAEEMAEIAGTDLGVTLELTDDNNFTLNMGIMGDEEDESISGTWKIDGDSLILNVEGEEASATYDDKTIAMDLDGMILTFEKE